MRHLKAVGLVALAIAALTGASTASATRLCSTNTTPCANVYPSDTTLDAHLQPGTSFAILLTGGAFPGIPTYTCSSSTLGLTFANQGGGEGVNAGVRLSGLSMTNCESLSPAGCSTQWTVGSLTGAAGTIGSTANMNGTLQITLPTVTLSCPFSGTCTFGGTGSVDAAVTGGNPARIDLITQTVTFAGTTTGFNYPCPASAIINAWYQTTTPLFVSTS